LVDIITDLDQRKEASLPDWLAVLDSQRISARETLNPLLNSETPDVRQTAFAALIRSGHLASVPLDPDALRSITRIGSHELQTSFLAPAQQALSSSESLPVRQAALFSLGRVPGRDTLIFNILAQHFVKPELTSAAAEAILARPQKTWPLEEATALLNTHLSALTSTPVEKRGDRSFTLASRVLTEISKLRNLPDTLEEIDALQLVPVTIGTVPDRMRYDRASMRVPSGTPVELRLDNSDVMKHNLVLCAPGARRKVGLAADALLADPTAIERDWIPDLPEVLYATPMANPKQSVVLRFITPEKPGSYPFLCSVPNHWRIMQGTMVVTDKSATGEIPNVLILTGEHEYRTRDSLSELAEHLRKDHQLNVIHIEANKKDNPQHFPDLDRHLPHADLVILSLRFLNLVPDQYQAIDQYLTHKPFIAIRTTTHLFRFPDDSDLAAENLAFPTRHFGTPYRGHHGHDSSQVNYVMTAGHPVMAGVESRFWTPDFLYAVNPLSVECTPLMIGQGLKGLQRATFRKVHPDNHATVLSDQDESRLIGSPHPLVWTIDNNQENRRALASTIGARKSFDNPNVRRLYLNAVLWCLDRDPDPGLSPSEPLEIVLLKEPLDSLARDARELGSIQRGRELFYGAAIGCAKCHDPAAGQPLGPDLMQKRDTKDIHLVESILQPSRVIHEGYHPVLVLTAAGRTHTGFHLRENERTLVIRDSVLGKKTLEFNKRDLEELTRLQRSTMPAGLVNQLKNRAEFLDLVRFVMAAADGDLPRRSRTSLKGRRKPKGRSD
jgi:putative heme-binding domain-containing protein